MGADLYIESISDKNRTEYEPRFKEAVAKREQVQAAYGAHSPEADAAHEEVLDLYDKMYDDSGYFRDSYNSSNLLWTLDLSWWNDITPLLNDEGYLPLEKIAWLKTEVEQRSELLERKIAERDDPFNHKDTYEQDAAYFREKLVQFRAFLGRALELGEPIMCSL